MVSIEAVEQIYHNAQQDTQRTVTEKGFNAAAEDQDLGTFFGRDAAICGEFRLYTFENNSRDPQLLLPVRNSLLTMAHTQGQQNNPWREEKNGAIIHEWRRSDTPKNIERLAQLKKAGWPVENGELRYFGSVDATPLFVTGVTEYFRITRDIEFFQALEPHVRNALHCMENDMDSYGDGFIRFSAKNRLALLNQGWKDSFDSIEITPNQRPKEPIALVEVQGYAYSAYLNAARAYSEVGETDYARQLYHKAGMLKARFNEEFWMPREEYFAHALDGNNSQIPDITSNVGHLLKSGIVDDKYVPLVVDRIMQPDMFTAGGIRTLSSESPRFSDEEPAAYHDGSIWTHDNALIYIGLKKTRFYKQAALVRDAVLDTQYRLFNEHGERNPELHIVTRDGILRPYDTANHPQSWVVEANLVWADPMEIRNLMDAERN